MPTPSFRASLLFLGTFTLAVCLALAILLKGIYNQSAGVQISQAQTLTAQACQELSRKFQWGVAQHSFEPNRENQFKGALLEIILDHYTAVEGGFWDPQKGFEAYAYPTYEGSGIKRDIPEAEKPFLESIFQAASESKSSKTEMRRGTREALIVQACGAGGTSIAWAMTRIPLNSSEIYENFRLGIIVLLGFVLITGSALTFLFVRWSRGLNQLEHAIRNYPADSFPEIPLDPGSDFNPIVLAFNGLNAKVKVSQESSALLIRKLHQAERLGTLGKMAASMAHEVRNPLATLRLKIENALVDPATRLPRSGPVLLEQLDRIDRLVQMMLASTQPLQLKIQTVDIPSWLRENFAGPREQAAKKSISLQISTSTSAARFDPFHLERALTNLLQNAIAFSPQLSQVSLAISQADGHLVIDVKDSGPGIAPEIRPHLFEAFSSARENGIGLGLMLVKEIAEAHGGRVREMDQGPGAWFQMEIPCPKF